MHLLELTIIYFAIGTPFGVYYVSAHPAESSASVFLNGVLSLVLWPGSALTFIFSYLTLRPDEAAGLSQVVRELKATGTALLADPDRRAFYNAVDRYVGLSEALNAPVGTSAIDGLESIGVMKTPVEAKAAVRNRNQRRLLVHRAAARDSLVSLILDQRTAECLDSLAAILHAGSHCEARGDLSAASSRSPADMDDHRVSIAA